MTTTINVDGHAVLLDIADLPALEGRELRVRENYGYLAVLAREGKRWVPLANVINPPPSGKLNDHKNRNSLDNTRSNLRHADRSQNARNRTYPRNPHSGYYGVRPHKDGGWQGIVSWTYKTGYKKLFFYTKVYTNPIDAARERDQLVRKYHGEFGVLNFPD